LIIFFLTGLYALLTGFTIIYSESVHSQTGLSEKQEFVYISVNGDYDTRMDLWRFLGRNKLALYEIFGFDPSLDSERLEKFELSNNVHSNYPPTLLIHAKNDHLVDLNQVNEFYSFLNDKNVIAEIYLVENGHSTELINQNPQAVDKIIEFFYETFRKE
jgi:dipeptidyl aminopeptidase/acylaminoacyl peptidase